jgi:hypothetical protein
MHPVPLTSLQCSKAAYVSTALLNTRATQGQRSGSLRDSLIAGGDAERGIWGRSGRGGGMQWSAITWCSASPIKPAGARTQVVPRRPYHRCSTGRRLRHCRRLHWAPARHITSPPRKRARRWSLLAQNAVQRCPTLLYPQSWRGAPR